MAFFRNQIKKILFYFVFFGLQIICCSKELKAEIFNVGFNQAWINDSYQQQWDDGHFDIVEVRRFLDLTKNAGAKTIRMWLFEGVDSPSLEWRDGKVSGLNPVFIKNFSTFLKESKIRNIQVYVTLFDFGLLRTTNDQNLVTRWWNLMNNEYEGLDAFQKNALTPLLKLLYQEEFRSTIFGIDVENEIDSSIVYFEFKYGWLSANSFVCKLKNQIHAAAPSHSSFIPVTASLGWPYIPVVSRGAENIIFDPNPIPVCVDFWYIHYYNDTGDVKNCDKIKDFIKKHGKKIYMGEFGQLTKSLNDTTQSIATTNFIKNAQNCGFSGALAWRLADGLTSDRYLSYETGAKGNMRDAYRYIKAFNEKSHFKIIRKNSEKN